LRSDARDLHRNELGGEVGIRFHFETGEVIGSVGSHDDERPFQAADAAWNLAHRNQAFPLLGNLVDLFTGVMASKPGNPHGTAVFEARLKPRRVWGAGGRGHYFPLGMR
jgi:hypothetical protein